MKLSKSNRGFDFLKHNRYVEPHDDIRLASQSSAIGECEDSWDRPGSSYLWIGDNHHLNREQVAEFVGYLNRWLKTGRLAE